MQREESKQYKAFGISSMNVVEDEQGWGRFARFVKSRSMAWKRASLRSVMAEASDSYFNPLARSPIIWVMRGCTAANFSLGWVATVLDLLPKDLNPRPEARCTAGFEAAAEPRCDSASRRELDQFLYKGGLPDAGLARDKVYPSSSRLEMRQHSGEAL